MELTLRPPRLPAATLVVVLAACGGGASVAGPAGPPTRPMEGPGPSAQLAAVRALGLDPQHLPPLGDVPEAAMKPLMDTFDDSLDACCEDCHVKGEPRASTKATRVSAGMWHRFTRELTVQDGSPVYCDSCHHGARRFLDRRDPAALRRWMRDNYVAKLRTAGGGAVSCATCHGEPFVPEIIERLWLAGGSAR